MDLERFFILFGAPWEWLVVAVILVLEFVLALIVYFCFLVCIIALVLATFALAAFIITSICSYSPGIFKHESLRKWGNKVCTKATV